MLLFGNAFGPAYANFWCFCIQLCSFLGGSNFIKCFQQAIALLYGRFRRSQQCCVQRMCAMALNAEVWVETVTEGGRRFMAAWRKEEVDAARHRQEKREATRLGTLLSQTGV